MPYTATPVWSYAVNWDGGVIERLEWKTDVMTSELGTEQRVARRLYPHRSFEAQFLLHGEDRQHFNIFASSATGKEFLIPIWHDVTYLTTAASAGADTLVMDVSLREFAVGELIFIRSKRARNFEVATVEEVLVNGLKLVSNLEKSWGKGTFVYPAKLGRFVEGTKPQKQTDTLFTATAEFKLTSNSPCPIGIETAYHRALPVYENPPDDNEALSFEFSRDLSVQDNEIAAPHVYDVRGGPIFKQAYAWAAKGRVAHRELRSFLYRMAGRYKAMYLPTFMNDLTLANDVASNDSYLDIVNVGFTDSELLGPGRQDLRIALRNGSILYARITDSVVVDEDVERLELLTPLFSTITTSDVLSISFMMVARLDQDLVELNHTTDADGLTLCTATWYGPTDASAASVFTSRPYPLQITETLDVAVDAQSGSVWSIDTDSADIVPSVVSIALPTVVAYRSYEETEEVDIDLVIVSIALPTVVAYRSYEEIEEVDVSLEVLNASLDRILVTYNEGPESVGVEPSIVGVILA